jgi:undecaprenyl-diphosphatase
VLYVALALIVSALSSNAFLRAIVWILAIALPIVVALSRLYRGMHHLSDVCAGALVGIGALLVALLAARACEAAVRRRRTTTTEETS